MLVAEWTRTLPAQGHVEAVAALMWRKSVVERMRLGLSNAHQLVSAGADGQILVWHPDTLQSVADGIQVVKNRAEVGIACASLSQQRGGGDALVLLASEVTGQTGGV